MAKLSKNGKRKLQEAELQLSEAGFNSVFQQIQERFPYDTIYSYWVNLKNGKAVLIVLVSQAHLLDSLRIYELNQVNLTDLLGQ